MTVNYFQNIESIRAAMLLGEQTPYRLILSKRPNALRAFPTKSGSVLQDETLEHI